MKGTWFDNNQTIHHEDIDTVCRAQHYLYKHEAMYCQCICGKEFNGQYALEQFAEHYRKLSVCRRCGRADGLFPDPSAYYCDAMTSNGAPLLCTHHTN